MSPSVLRVSGPAFERNGVLSTPRASIHICEVCSVENAPHGFTDAGGKRTYYCTSHNPDNRQIMAQASKETV